MQVTIVPKRKARMVTWSDIIRKKSQNEDGVGESEQNKEEIEKNSSYADEQGV